IYCPLLHSGFLVLSVKQGSYVTYLTPAQQTQLAQISSDFYRQVQALMTPEQQPQYSKNLAARLRINAACDAKQPLMGYPAAGRIVNQPPSKNTAQPKTIVDIAAANPEFSTLVTAVKAAGLVETLSGSQPFTVFAPTNEAFAALPKGTLEKLLQPENRNLLRKVLTYHVVSGDLMARNLRSGRVATVQGSPVAVQVQNGRVRVNNANVVKADVDAKNGVIHVIDKVLLPPGL
ncbi:fasciclin domain-containing protein, partial [Phormidesmis sp. 146-33]